MFKKHHSILSIMLTMILLTTTLSLSGCSNINPINPKTTENITTLHKYKNAITALNELVLDEGMQKQIINQLYITETDSEKTLYQKLAECDSLILQEDASNNIISSLESLALFPNLKELTIKINSWDNTRIEDFTPITQLTNLESLSIFYDVKDAQIDYSFVTKLKNLKELFLSNCHIEDISFLKNMPQLERLYLYHNPITDLSVLEYLPNLVELELMENENASHVEVVGTLTKMEYLGLVSCGIEDLSFLKELTHLKELNLHGNEIRDITPLAGLTELEQLRISENHITDITPLKNVTKLWNLSLDDNEISDISIFAGMNDLNQLSISNNKITDLSPLSGKEELVDLYVAGNPIQSLAPVEQVPILGFGTYYDTENLTDEQTALLDFWVKELYPELSKYRCYDYITGDINKDGYIDTAFVIDELLLHPDEEYSAERRYLILLIQQADGSYKSVADVPHVMDSSAGGMRGEPYRGILLENGYLILSEAWGSSTGATDTCRYLYQNDTLTCVEQKQLSNCNFSIGWLYDVKDEISGQNIGYAIGYAITQNGYRLQKLFLYDSDTPWHKAFVSIDLYDISYIVHDTPIQTNMTSTEALELYKESLSANVTKVSLPYTSEQKTNLELLNGVSLPDYYYEVITDEAEGENYFYYEHLEESHNGQIVHMIHHITSDNDTTYLIYDETGEIK